jgi:anti-sigma regulatory factor (Ser/Thr protein kinase)
VLLDRLGRANGSALPTGARVLEVALPPAPASAGDARRALAGYCSRNHVPDNIADTAALATSELVTNALLHARTPILVLAEYDRDTLTVAVQDGEAILPTLLPADPQREGGRGVAIIDRLATIWGVHRTRLGKVVWVNIDEERSERQPQPS